MTDDQSGRVAIVTGASRGIGAAVAKRLAAQGIAVVVNFVSRSADADQVVKRIVDAGGSAIAVAGDVSEIKTAKALFDAAEERFGGADILVNNAGLAAFGLVASFEDAAFERLLANNLTAVFRLVREGANRLRNGGRIINISSSVVGLYQPGYAGYAATKGAVEAMTHVLAKELASRDITVNAVAPGPVATEFFLAGKSPELIASIANMNPFGRLGQPDEIANVVSLLVSRDASWISGQVVRANGGVI